MKRYQAYKASGIEWLGQVPKDWLIKRLKFVADINPSRQAGMTDDAQCVFIPMEAMNSDGTFNQSLRRPVSELKTGFTCFAKDDVIFAKITPCFENGKGALLAGLATDIGFGSTEFHVLRMRKGNTIPRFLYYLSVSGTFRRLGEAFMQGVAGQKRVTNDFVCDFIAGIPSPVAQEQIANFLDLKTGQIDALIAKKERMVELLKEERAAVINQAVTKGLDSNIEMKDSGVKWFGKVPKHWGIKKLKFVAHLKSGDGIDTDLIKGEDRYPVFGGNGLRGYTSAFTHDGNFILIGRQGALCGNVNYANGKFWASEHAVVVTLNVGHDVVWLGELLRSMNLNQYSQSAAQPGLAVDSIQNLSVPVPPHKEQKEIATFLEKRINQVYEQISRDQRSIELLKEYRTALISEAVTGKIDVRNE